MDPMYGQRAKQYSNFLWPHLLEPQKLLVLTSLFRLVLVERLLRVNHYLELELKIDFISDRAHTKNLKCEMYEIRM